MIKIIDGSPILIASYRTAPNIGIIKYWGKWHEDEIIPLNVNIGVTLSSDDLQTVTTVTLKNSGTDELILND
jgi:diphosphomevalonate decarboxylase